MGTVKIGKILNIVSLPISSLYKRSSQMKIMDGLEYVSRWGYLSKLPLWIMLLGLLVQIISNVCL